MPRQQLVQNGRLGSREAQQASGAPPRTECTPPFLGPGGCAYEVRPRRTRRDAMELLEGALEYRRVTLVGFSLLPAEVQRESDQIKAGKEPSRQVADCEVVDGRADQLRDPRDGDFVARRRGGEAQAEGRGAHLERFVADAEPEVMNLVDDQDIEPIAQ